MRKKVCGITTRALTFKTFMTENFKYLSNHGYDTYALFTYEDIFSTEDRKQIHFIDYKMERGNVSPVTVLKCIYGIYKILRKERFDIINYSSSNAALYASIAGWLARTPVRIYSQWGISYDADYKGLKRVFYKFMEYVTCSFSTSVQPDSFANLDFAIAEGLYPRRKGTVIYNGSATGVDFVRFDEKLKEKWRAEIRNKYNVPADAFAFGYIGRIVPQKGMNELFASFLEVQNENTYLFVVGPPDEIDNLYQELVKKIKSLSNVIFTGIVMDPEKYYAAFDFFVLPSYREGFGLVVLEASAMRIPSIVSNIKGPTDLIIDGYNGYICDVQSVSSLSSVMNAAISMSKNDYETMANNSYTVAKDKFDAHNFQKAFWKNRDSLLSQHNK